jgi:SM-20-related protein
MDDCGGHHRSSTLALSDTPWKTSAAWTLWERVLSRAECLQTIAAMANVSPTAGDVLRAGADITDRRLRSCFEHVLDSGQGRHVTAALGLIARTVLTEERHLAGHLLDGPKFCSYPEGGYFRAHRDRSRDRRDPVSVRTRSWSFTCVLNDDDPADGLPTYDGGTFVIYVPDADGRVKTVNVRPPAGSIVIFRADLMHEVRPVRSGTRFAAVAWLYDPRDTLERMSDEEHPAW